MPTSASTCRCKYLQRIIRHPKALCAIFQRFKINRMQQNAIELRGVCKSYRIQNDGAAREVKALQDVNLTVEHGEFLALVGRSGCGKSTLLNLLGGLDRPDSGQIRVGGQNLESFDESAFTRYRRETVGIVFQFFNLLPLLTVLENAALPALLAGKPRRQSLERAVALLDQVGLKARLSQQASLLSGGEMQRVAVARALINDPQVLLADEPTGNLDSQSAGDVLHALRALSGEGRSVVMVTHSREAAAIADTIREMRDGRFVNCEL